MKVFSAISCRSLCLNVNYLNVIIKCSYSVLQKASDLYVN